MGIIQNDEGDPVIQIANEFTVVKVSYVRTGNGERVVISSPRLGFEVQLDPLQLESLTWQEPELFSKLLNSPYGPGVTMTARPLSDIIAKD